MYPDAIQISGELKKRDAGVRPVRRTQKANLDKDYDLAANYCPSCYLQFNSTQEKEAKESSARLDQKKKFLKIYKITPTDISSRAGYKSYCKMPKSGTYFLISLKWLCQWKVFLDNGGVIGSIDNSSLICEHNKVLFDVSTFLDNPEKNSYFAILPEVGWNDLKEIYNGGPDVKVIVENDQINVDICQDCSNKKSRELEEAERSFSDECVEVTIEEKRGSQLLSKRRSKRQKATIVGVSSSNSVEILKLLIFQSHDIPPGEQVIYYNDTPLVKNELTLEDYNVRKNGIWRIERTDPVDIFLSSEAMDERFLGFGGTALSLNANAFDYESDDEVIDFREKGMKRKRDSCSDTLENVT